MRVLFATAELSPVAAVGGLAAAAAGLGAALRSAGVDLDLVMPDYGGITLVDETTFDLDVPDWVGAAVVRRGCPSGRRSADRDLGARDGPTAPVPAGRRDGLA